MKFVSFNVNGIRSHYDQVLLIIEKINPEIISLQETKVINESFPEKIFLQHGYKSYVHGQKQHHGVAFLTRLNMKNIFTGFKNNFFNERYRVISSYIKTKIGNVYIINIYSPNGESKKNLKKFEIKKIFYKSLFLFLNKFYEKNMHILIMGDMNISPEDLDVGLSLTSYKRWLSIGKCSFLPEEREWIKKIFKWGFVDVFRFLNPDKKKFSWFDYRSEGYIKNVGLRIDLFLSTFSLLSYIEESGMIYSIRSMDKTSDHVPIWIKLNF
ncbi:xthA [Wigglesworthia glossinidia endosymbiont of Glossina brevipalpis]|uniref:XthA protein n=1 Tax=Wigglesworthia glossinidia brevipalpis TaxID=36870 RepID=Q8D2I3_WIGBR|nr:xthA [Wigglesworthia glossinidia endosymbiont of Glossina brevipalpis]